MQRKAYAVPINVPTLAQLRSADLLIPLMLGLAFVLPLALAFAGVGMRSDKGTALVINEAFVNPGADQSGTWVELYNTTDEPIVVDGWTIGTVGGTVQTLSGTVDPQSYLVVKAPKAWSADADAVILSSADRTIVDDVHWGAAPAESPIKSWGASATRGPAPNASLVRNIQGFDSDTAKDWLQTIPTPNQQSPVSLNRGIYRILFDITNYVSLIAGFLLWGAFILIGLIAKRFEMLTGQRSYWMAMVIAPIGIVIYNLIQSYSFFTAGKMTECKTGLSFAACQQGWAFVPLFLSAVAMAYVVYHFYGIARRILEV
jgi:hypothetical protein